MLPKHRRLRAAEVRAILKNGRRLTTQSLTVMYIKEDGGRAAVVISKKIAKNAVERNVLRRTIYHALSNSLPSHVSAVFLAQKNISDYTSDIKTLCSKLSS